MSFDKCHPHLNQDRTFLSPQKVLHAPLQTMPTFMPQATTNLTSTLVLLILEPYISGII